MSNGYILDSISLEHQHDKNANPQIVGNIKSIETDGYVFWNRTKVTLIFAVDWFIYSNLINRVS